MADVRRLIDALGHGVAVAGRFAGRTVADGYRAIDPDVIRHAVQVPLLSYTLLAGRDHAVEPGEPDGHPPLVFVHGLGGGRGDFLLMGLYLRLHGRRRSYRIRFEPGQTADGMAKALSAFVRAVKKATGERQVEIVAHSLGGVVARLAVQNHRLAPAVRTLITLGSPHAGTHSARFGNTGLIRELRPDSDLIVRLNAKAWPKGVRGVTCFSRNDLMVLPAESAAAPGTEQIDLSPFTHYSYLIDPRSWATVARALENRPRQPGD